MRVLLTLPVPTQHGASEHRERYIRTLKNKGVLPWPLASKTGFTMHERLVMQFFKVRIQVKITFKLPQQTLDQDTLAGLWCRWLSRLRATLMFGMRWMPNRSRPSSDGFVHSTAMDLPIQLLLHSFCSYLVQRSSKSQCLMVSGRGSDLENRLLQPVPLVSEGSESGFLSLDSCGLLQLWVWSHQGRVGWRRDFLQPCSSREQWPGTRPKAGEHKPGDDQARGLCGN